jgi:hypothetical protein
VKRFFAEHLIRFSSLFLLLAAGVSIAQQAAKQAKQSAPAGINLDSPFTPPPDIKVDTVQVAPFVQGVQFAVSPQGIHVAIPAPSGSRTVVMYDNTAGPKFDRLFPEGNGSSPVIFSPDGKRYAYCGAAGTDWVVMVDCKRAHSRQRWSRGRRDLQLPVGIYRQQPARLFSQYAHVERRAASLL